ncbi:MAG: DUF2149 domain-containing protein [Clostridiales Family XIII bacterium]|jgi:hypothetical protein|nr:DUF2149 domain-containing protein [Clostridiales Family XIII bacterium]
MLRSSLRNDRKYFDDDDFSPMEGAINIVDAMLVFACGLMLSIVIYWNVDIQNYEYTPINQGQQVQEMESDAISDEIKNAIDGTGQYQRLGAVYQDPATGKMYLATEGGGQQELPAQSGTDGAAAGSAGQEAAQGDSGQGAAQSGSN